MPYHATSQLTEFLIHNPDIIDPDQLNWDYEYPERETQNGSYDSMSKKREIMTSPHGKEKYPSVPLMGISALHSKNGVGTPRTPIDTPRRKPMNIRESNWRQEQSNVQGASDMIRRDTVDWRRVKLPPGQKPPPNITRSLPRFICKFCHMKHSGRICPCRTCVWIHLTLKHPDIPYEAPEEVGFHTELLNVGNVDKKDIMLENVQWVMLSKIFNLEENMMLSQMKTLLIH